MQSISSTDSRTIPRYALSTLKIARDAKADWIVLCDTNGGTFPYEIQSIIRQVKKEIRPSSRHPCSQ